MATENKGCLVINLDSRPDRWDFFLAGADNWREAFGCGPQRCSAVAGIDLPGFNQPPWFKPGMTERRKLSWAGKAGCILSHRKAISIAVEKGWDQVLVLEDDALLTDHAVRLWKEDLSQLVKDLPADWGAVYLCTTTAFPPSRKVAAKAGTKLVETSGALGTVAYLLNGRVFQGLLRALPDEKNIWSWVARHKTIDRWYSQNLVRFGRVYLFAPSLGGHHPGSSDISMTPEDAPQLDFSLASLRYTEVPAKFARSYRIRKLANALRRSGSLLRLAMKHLKGL